MILLGKSANLSMICLVSRPIYMSKKGENQQNEIILPKMAIITQFVGRKAIQIIFIFLTQYVRNTKEKNTIHGPNL